MFIIMWQLRLACCHLGEGAMSRYTGDGGDFLSQSLPASSFLKGIQAGWEALWWRGKAATEKRRSGGERKWKCDGSSNAVYRNVSSGKGDILSVATQKKKKKKKRWQIAPLSEWPSILRGPNLSSPIKAIGAQQSGLVAQWLVRAKLIGCNVWQLSGVYANWVNFYVSCQVSVHQYV